MSIHNPVLAAREQEGGVMKNESMALVLAEAYDYIERMISGEAIAPEAKANDDQKRYLLCHVLPKLQILIEKLSGIYSDFEFKHTYLDFTKRNSRARSCLEEIIRRAEGQNAS